MVYWLPKMSTCTTPLSSTVPSQDTALAVDPFEFGDEVLDAVRDLLALGGPLALDAVQQVELREHVVELAPGEALLAGADDGLELPHAARERRVVVLEAR